jgi:hypothetical protein
MAGEFDDDATREEWEYLTFDPEETCAVCGLAIRQAQAAGRIGGAMVHARCTEKPPARPEKKPPPASPEPR